jgi:hypothetical protein
MHRAIPPSLTEGRPYRRIVNKIDFCAAKLPAFYARQIAMAGEHLSAKWNFQKF